jgi:hypothetical protein
VTPEIFIANDEGLHAEHTTANGPFGVFAQWPTSPPPTQLFVVKRTTLMPLCLKERARVAGGGSIRHTITACR